MEIGALLQSSQFGLGSLLIKWTCVMFVCPIFIRVHITCCLLVHETGFGLGDKKGFIWYNLLFSSWSQSRWCIFLLLFKAFRAVSLKEERSILGILMLMAASLAATSAFSFPGMFLWAGIHMKVTERGEREAALSCMIFIISFDVPWFCIARIELRESLAIKKDIVFFHFCSVSSMAFRMASASMVKIELISSEENLKVSSSVIIVSPVLTLDFDPSVYIILLLYFSCTFLRFLSTIFYK